MRTRWGKPRGYAFIEFARVEDATRARRELTGAVVDGREVRVDYSLTRRAHTPTPGCFHGR